MDIGDAVARRLEEVENRDATILELRSDLAQSKRDLERTSQLYCELIESSNEQKELGTQAASLLDRQTLELKENYERMSNLRSKTEAAAVEHNNLVRAKDARIE